MTGLVVEGPAVLRMLIKITMLSLKQAQGVAMDVLQFGCTLRKRWKK